MKKAAIKFSKKWKDAKYEKGESQTFWNEFFTIFKVERTRVASFEEPIKKLGDKQGFIDLFWKGKLLIEHKSLGRDLGKAKTQAFDYFPNIKDEELPKYILVCDFQNFELLDLENGKEYKFKLSELSENLHLFEFFNSEQNRVFDEKIDLNVQAGSLIGGFHEELKKSGYEGKELEIFLIRHLFLLFADNTDIWSRNLFGEFIDTITESRYIGSEIAHLFQILDTPNNQRSLNLSESLRKFPYINGSLFKEYIKISAFDDKLKESFLKTFKFDWSKINPVIFGSIFQASMNENTRGELGSHFTSEKNILKLLKPLFLDELKNEFEKNRGNRKELEKLHTKIGNLKFFDPACGSGNFLIITYRELKLLEFEIMKELNSLIQYVSIKQFYGIEIDELAAKITEVAMLLIDHQMSLKFEKMFEKQEFNIPIKKVANIFHQNSLTTNWEEVFDVEIDYIFGNPPFLGAKMQNSNQKKDMALVFENIKSGKNLDLVAAWFLKASEYMENHEKTQTAFVSTNSITQGEQVATLWYQILENYKHTINFAHQTFKWKNEAKNNAQVHCVIIGFGKDNGKEKKLFEYETVKSEPKMKLVKEINPYLISGKTTYIFNRSKHIQNGNLEMSVGSMPNDGGNFLFTESEKKEFLEKEPKAKKFFRVFLGAREFLNNEIRYILWLGEATPKEINSMRFVKERIENVREFRKNSKSKPTKALSETPMKFHIENIPKDNYLFIPEVSSEHRKYIPIGFLDKNSIASDSGIILPSATLYHFGILTSSIHMAFMRNVAGRLESRYRYSIGVVYNNFPFPTNVTKAQENRIIKLSQAILDIREEFSDSSLSDLYNQNSMPEKLLKAHKKLDSAVDKLYGLSGKITDEKRVIKIFEFHKSLSLELDEPKPKRKTQVKKKVKINTVEEEKKHSQGSLDF